jgi:hypothetical protein
MVLPNQPTDQPINKNPNNNSNKNWTQRGGEKKGQRREAFLERKAFKGLPGKGTSLQRPQSRKTLAGRRYLPSMSQPSQQCLELTEQNGEWTGKSF